MKMTKNELMLLRTKQKGMRAVREAFIDIKQYLEPENPEDRRRKRFLAKQKYFKERGISGY